MIEMLWPTPVVIATVGDEDLNRGLVEAQYLGGKHNRFTNIWDIDHPAIKRLKSIFVEQVAELEAERFRMFGRGSAKWTTSRGWMNIHRNGDWTSPHNHAQSQYAGVYYVRAEGECGDLLLQDPAAMAPWCNNVDGSKDCRVYKRIKATSGKMVVFPGHIVHCTDINKTSEPRICIATNFQLADDSPSS